MAEENNPVVEARFPDMEEYLRQHDLLYEKAPLMWEEGIPLANGDMGALLWGDGNPLKLTLDKYDTWERRFTWPKDKNYNYRTLYTLIKEGRFKEAKDIFQDKPRKVEPYPARLPLPRMEFFFTEDINDFQARLKLYEALVKGKLYNNEDNLKFELFIHSKLNLGCLRVTYSSSLKLKKIKVGLEHLEEKAKNTLKKWGYPLPEKEEKQGVNYFLQEIPQQGKYVVAWRCFKKNKEDIILFSIVTSNDAQDPLKEAIKLINSSCKKGFARLKDEHTVFWKRYWNKSFLSLDDSLMENLYYVEMYKLACSSSKYPCTLQGLWTEDGVLPPWSGDYHLDMNVEESYWPIYVNNRLELGKPLYEKFFKNLPWFEEMGKRFFGFEGAHSRCEMGPEGQPIFGYYTANFWPGNGAWLAHLFYLHWRYSQDKEFLKNRAYPFMRSFMKTYLNLLEKDSNGVYHLPLTAPPEWGESNPESWGRDAPCDLGLIKFLAEGLIETCKVLNIEDSDFYRWKDVLENLASYPADETGLLIYKEQPLTHSHRHHSHLMPIHPLGVLTVEDGEEAKDLIYRSLHQLRRRGTGEWTGWSFPWASLIASRAEEPYMAWQMLRLYFNFITPNTFHINGDPRHFGLSLFDYHPMTLEAGFCFAAALAEMMLQSWKGIIRIFPSLPGFLANVSFINLRCEGAFLVSALRKDGETKWVKIKSEAGGLCIVKNPFKGYAYLFKEGKLYKKFEERGIMFNTKRGESFLLFPRDSIDDLALYLPERSLKEKNYFGVKKLERF